MVNRINTKQIKIGNRFIGNDNNILIQSMTTTKTSDINNTISQILELEKVGCELIRVSILDELDANAIKSIKSKIHIPLIADIHYSSDLAIKAIDNGADKIRINPGNFPLKDLEKIILEAKKYDIAIRIGVNYGSIEKEYINLKPEEAIFESVKKYINLMESYGFYNIVISAKSSDCETTIKANKLIADNFNYPIHIGITEAGDEISSLIKSSYALTTLINLGIGSTIRVSINTDKLINEVIAAKEILKLTNINTNSITIIACPTCGRILIDTVSIVKKLRQYTNNINKNITVAIMGCAVNGIGEASNADIGIAGGNNCAVLFKKGKVIKNINYNEILETLIEEINKF